MRMLFQRDKTGKLACAAGLVWALSAVPATAGDLEVRVTNRVGGPVEGAVVYAMSDAARPDRPAPQTMAVMQQVGRQFLPHVLVVRKGTTVDFPNNDTVSHHVYSFSEAGRFELPLYRETKHPPVRFDTPGVVVIGCNIHDDMLGYIVVVDTPHFAVTDAEGRAVFSDLTPGGYEVHSWSSRARQEMVTGRVVIDDPPDPDSLGLRFNRRLLPPTPAESGSLAWSDY